MRTPAIEDRAGSAAFAELAREIGAQGILFRFQARGRSMLPVIEDGDILHVQPVGTGKLRCGEVVLFRNEEGFKAHRIFRKKGDVCVTRGDAGMHTDGEISVKQVLGRVVAKECWKTGRLVPLAGRKARASFRFRQLRSFISGVRMQLRPKWTVLGAAAFLLLGAVTGAAQIAVSGSATQVAALTGTGALTFATFSNYVVPVGTNRLMIVAVSISTQGNNVNSSVSTIKYGTQSLTKINATVLEAASRRVEMWQLLAPTAGTATITINGNKTGSNNNKLGVVAGVITFTGVDQSSPLRSSTAASGSSATATASLSSSGADFVLDTLCVAGTVTVTSPAGQTSRWNTRSGNTGQDAAGVASSLTGSSPTATISENLSGSAAWTIAAISIRAFGADLAITKVGTPDPVLQNASLTYTLTITNNGLQNAPGVLVVDTLPTQVTYVSATWTNGSNSGSCSQTVGTVSCTIGALGSGGTATVTILTTPNTPSAAVNTAVVSPVGVVDPNFNNNTATFTSTIEFPNSVRLNSFTAAASANGAIVSWNSGGELHNLGFNIYRDVNGEKTRLNSSLIAGAALLMRDTVEQHAAKTYRWIDRSPVPGALYWLEDVDLNGSRTMHGPISPAATGVSSAVATRSAMIQDLATSAEALPHTGVAMTPSEMPVAHVRETIPYRDTKLQAETAFNLAKSPAVKILIDHEGWYRVRQPELVAAGFAAGANARLLHLYAEGVEQPIKVTGGERFGPQSAIEFYGTAIDTPYSGQRVYWLTAGQGPGLRIAERTAEGSSGVRAQSFMQTLELKPRTTYFGTLLREDIDDFFGPLVSSTPESETINAANLAGGEGKLSVTLQGVTEGQAHTVMVMLNGNTLGELNFADQASGHQEFTVPAGVLTSGANTVTLAAQQGENDLSLVDTIDLSFPHTFTAESDTLKFSADAGENVSIGGFTHPVRRLIDITDPQQPSELRFESETAGGGYALAAGIPWTSPGTHTLLALTEPQFATPAALLPHHPSSLHAPQPGAAYVIVTGPQFAAQVQPLAQFHRGQGTSVAVVSTEDIYDEFNFGEHSPFALRNFLSAAMANWKDKPKYLLLAGDASVDPRNYLGFGSFDFVPTRIVSTAELMTASDDWFSDFDNTGAAKIATGRLPARTPDDARIMVSKILSYSAGTPSAWNSHALMVADADDPGLSFSQQSQAIQNLLPKSISSTDIFTSALGTATAQQNLIDGINSGQLLVNYNGHGSVEVWSSGSLFDDAHAAALTNGNKLPLFVIMNCLNGFFHDVYTQSMAEALMLAPNGGAVAVWASSGLTAPEPQFSMDRNFAQSLSSTANLAVGDAAMKAKAGISDQDVKKTFILFGDPAMRLQRPAIPSSGTPKPVIPQPAPAPERRDGASRNFGKPAPTGIE